MLSTSFLHIIKCCKSVFIILIASLWLTACLFSQSPAPTSDLNRQSATKVELGHSHTVKSGETLYSIAWRYGLYYRELAERNNIGSDFLIHPGQVLKLSVNSKDKGEKSVAKPATARTTATASDTTSRSHKPVSQPNVSRKPVLSTAASVKAPPRSKKKSSSKAKVTTSKMGVGNVIWRWPAKGEVLTNFSVKNATNKGIDIKGKKGDSVHAAASGSVVYAGSGLRGYGKLIIIKHNDVYLSAYAHNSKISVKEGQYVKAGQYIANIGSSGSRTDSVKLHFEIRRNGKPIDPLRLLPKRKS